MAYFASLVPLTAIYMILVLGLNIQYGLTGILNFTYITFVAIGAYVTGVLSLGPPTNGQTYILGAHVPFPLNILAGGAAAVLFEHNLAVIESLCQDVVVMAAGTVLARGTMAELRGNAAVIEAYLGEGRAYGAV